MSQDTKIEGKIMKRVHEHEIMIGKFKIINSSYQRFYIPQNFKISTLPVKKAHNKWSNREKF